MFRTITVVSFFLFPVFCLAGDGIVKDSVEVEYVSGMTRLESSESINVQIDRVTTTFRTQNREVDQFINAVQMVLSEHTVEDDWQLVVPDAPYIIIRILIDGRRIQMSSSHTVFERNENLVATQRGIETLNGRSRAELLLQENNSFRQHRIAFEKILSLVCARVNGQIHK